MDKNFIGERISKLREAKKLSASRLSKDLGQNKDYIAHIERGDSLPSFDVLENICQYFGLTMSDFFDTKTEYPVQYQELMKELDKLDSQELEKIIEVVRLITLYKK